MLIAKNRSAQAMQSFTLTVDRAPEIMKIHARKVRIGSALIVPITTVGYPPPVLTESGRLPKGLSFTDFGNGTAALTGTPAPGTSGSYPITVTATNRSGMVCRSFTLKIPQSRSALVSSPRLPNVADSLDLPVPASAASGSH
jgi:hypothetical protein